SRWRNSAEYGRRVLGIGTPFLSSEDRCPRNRGKSKCGYAIKVGYWSWPPLKAIAAACRHWQPVAPGVTGHETELVIPQWQDLRLRVALYRKHVNHETRRNFQLDLFT